MRPLRRDDWPALEELFGKNGACAGCWCMFWRSRSRRDFDALRGEAAKAAFRGLVTSGVARGLLAIEGDRAVGWCALGPREDFPLTETKPSYVVDDTAEVFSINCFFISKDRRSRGVARRLLRAAVHEARRSGARVLEGYPSVVLSGAKQASSSLYKGTLSMFEAEGFRVVQRLHAGTPLVRLSL